MIAQCMTEFEPVVNSCKMTGQTKQEWFFVWFRAKSVRKGHELWCDGRPKVVMNSRKIWMLRFNLVFISCSDFLPEFLPVAYQVLPKIFFQSSHRWLCWLMLLQFQLQWRTAKDCLFGTFRWCHWWTGEKSKFEVSATKQNLLLLVRGHPFSSGQMRP